jgi:hypothetical protein
MTWNYARASGHATHCESGEGFTVVLARNVQSADDVELRPDPTSKHPWPTDELATLKAELWEHMLEEQRRTKLRRDIEKAFAGKRSRAAEVLTELTSRQVSARSIQAWLSEPHKPGSRRCPEWAVKALETYVKSLDASKPASTVARELVSPKQWSAEILDEECLAKAQERIQADRLREQRWQDAKMRELPALIAAFERETLHRLSNVERKLFIIRTALRSPAAPEELRESILTALDERDQYDWEINQTRKAIEGGTEEFSNKEGVLKS